MGVRQRLRAAAINAYLGEGAVGVRRGWHRLLRRRRVDYFHQVGDPYSHLMVQLLPRLLAHAELDVHFKVVPPPAAELDAERDLRRTFSRRDCLELSQRYDVAFPNEPTLPDDTALRRGNAILLKSRDAPKQLSIAAEVGAALWRGDAARLDALAAEHGVFDGDVDAALGAGQRKLSRAGHYQGGTLRFEGEWYLGPDRLHYVEEQLRSEGADIPPSLSMRDDPSSPSPAPDAMPSLDMYFSFRSPYSYLALDRTAELARRYDIPLTLKAVLPMVMRGFEVPLSKRLYLARDAAREARRLGVPFGRLCDPLGVGVERCLAIFHRLAAEEALAFASSATRGIWSEALDVADDDDLAAIVRRAGIDWSEARAWLDDDSWRDTAERHRLELRDLGLWGVPSFHIGGYTTWGQDRLDRVEECLASLAEPS